MARAHPSSRTATTARPGFLSAALLQASPNKKPSQLTSPSKARNPSPKKQQRMADEAQEREARQALVNLEALLADFEIEGQSPSPELSRRRPVALSFTPRPEHIQSLGHPNPNLNPAYSPPFHPPAAAAQASNLRRRKADQLAAFERKWKASVAQMDDYLRALPVADLFDKFNGNLDLARSQIVHQTVREAPMSSEELAHRKRAAPGSPRRDGQAAGSSIEDVFGTGKKARAGVAESGRKVVPGSASRGAAARAKANATSPSTVSSNRLVQWFSRRPLANADLRYSHIFFIRPARLGPARLSLPSRARPRPAAAGFAARPCSTRPCHRLLRSVRAPALPEAPRHAGFSAARRSTA